MFAFFLLKPIKVDDLTLITLRIDCDYLAVVVFNCVRFNHTSGPKSASHRGLSSSVLGAPNVRILLIYLYPSTLSLILAQFEVKPGLATDPVFLRLFKILAIAGEVG